MMKRIYFSVMAVVATMFAACSNEELPQQPVVDEMTDTPVTITAGVANLVTRAEGTTPLTNGSLGLFFTTTGNNDAKYNAANREVKYENSKWVIQGTDPLLWVNKKTTVTVQAYVPYNTAWNDISTAHDIEVKTAQNEEENLKASDLLWASAEVDPAATTQTGDITYNNGALDITLKHILSKLIINVRFTDEFPNMMIANDDLSIEGLNTNGKINLSNANISTTSSVAPITAYNNPTASTGYDETFEAILLPQSSSFSVKILLDSGRTFQWEPDSEFSFAKGTAYTLNLVVGKDKVTLENITATDWTNVTGGQLETE